MTEQAIDRGATGALPGSERGEGVPPGAGGPYREAAVVFDCAGETLIGVVSVPDAPIAVGVLVVVGGPQYRVGSHRQFVLLARDLAAHGIACMRFDYRGMGDSSSPMRTFEEVADDIVAAAAAFREAVPAIDKYVLWGLCDGASAACFHAATDAAVAGLVLVNPWVRTEAGEAQVLLRRYYLRRLADPAFWRKLVGGRLEVGRSLGSLRGLLGRALQRDRPPDAASAPASPLPIRMAQAVEAFRGPLLVILSDNDYTADEFRHCCERSPAWRAALAPPRATVETITGADHTFSSAELRNRVAALTRTWVGRLA